MNICREHGIRTGTFYKWKAKCGDMEVSEAWWLKALEEETRCLRLWLPIRLDVVEKMRRGPRLSDCRYRFNGAICNMQVSGLQID